MKKILITGSAGFIGSHLAKYFIKSGHQVVGVDNLSRKGTDVNLRILKDTHTKNFIFYRLYLNLLKHLA